MLDIPETLTDQMEDLRRRSRLLAALYLAQEQFGWLSPEAIQHVSRRLGLNLGLVKSTASFYTMFRLAPQGEYLIQVCEGLSCYLVGGEAGLVEYLSKELDLQPGESTDDKTISLEVVGCIAACDFAPALRVNDVLYKNMTREKIDDLIRAIQAGEL